MRIQSNAVTGECKAFCPRCSKAYSDWDEVMRWTDRHNITRRQFFLCEGCRNEYRGRWLRLKRTSKGCRGSLHREFFERAGACS